MRMRASECLSCRHDFKFDNFEHVDNNVHFVDEVYDHGKIIFQEKCEIENGETIESLAKKIHILEYKHFPQVIANVIQKQNQR